MTLSQLISCGIVLLAALPTTRLNAATTDQGKYVHTVPGNPYLPLWEHLPDGEPRVFEDPDNPGKYRIYIIGSHDVSYKAYCGADIHMWSAPVEDLAKWRDEGAIFTYNHNGTWDIMFAPDLVEVREKDGSKTYYLYPHSRGPHREAMVAKGKRPDGPFEPVNLDEKGERTIEGSILGFDPSIYVEQITDSADPDFEKGYRAYGYWGFQRSSAAQLDPNTMYSVRPGTEIIPFHMPASFSYGKPRHPDVEYPCIYPGEDLGQFNFFEASSIRKVGNKYVAIYSGYSGPEYGLGSSNSTLRYAYADTPLGPWKIGGVLVDSRAPELGPDGTELQVTNGGHNTHGSIEEINGQWYVFYHRPPRNFGFARQAVVAPIAVSWDKKPVAEGGKVIMTAYDPYVKGGHKTLKDSKGNEYTGAEVTSEGFHVYGLDPYRYYPAGIACYLTNTQLQQDTWDIWDNNAPVAGIANGNVVGFKYFGFGGLSKDKMGLKAFAGTRKGNNTKINLFLNPLTDKSFKVHVWMDAPGNNGAWKGTKIAEIVVPEGCAADNNRKFAADVSKFVDKLDKKHAIYLVAEGDDNTPLCDLIGLGFSSKDKDIECPCAPRVSIAVDGKEINLPAVPTRMTPKNGLIGYDHYDVYFALADNSKMPEVTASADNDNVKIEITQASDAQNQADVKCDYNGIVKTYHVHFTK